MATTLIVPGLHGSGDGHWQRWWLDADPEARIVEQDHWDHPRLEEWLERLAGASYSHPGAVLVAHSLGVALVAHAARRYRLPVAGALLVAPADVDDENWATPQVAAFGPMPGEAFHFPSIVVSSRNDPYCSHERASRFAAGWGSRQVDLGDSGHINALSGFGAWPRGLALAASLRTLGDGRLQQDRRSGPGARPEFGQRHVVEHGGHRVARL